MATSAIQAIKVCRLINLLFMLPPTESTFPGFPAPKRNRTAAREDRFSFVFLRNLPDPTDLPDKHAMKMPRPGLTLSTGLDMFVKPLRRFRERGDSVRLTFPHANHRNDQKYKCCEFEDRATQRAVGDRADDAE